MIERFCDSLFFELGIRFKCTVKKYICKHKTLLILWVNVLKSNQDLQEIEGFVSWNLQI